MVEDYSKLNGRRIEGVGYLVIEAVQEHGFGGHLNAIHGSLSECNRALESNLEQLGKDVAKLTGEEIPHHKQSKERQPDIAALTHEELKAYRKPGFIYDRQLFIVDKIPALEEFENPEAIYIAFPEEGYTAKSNFLFISPCYKIANIYSISTEKRFAWSGDQPTKTIIGQKAILERLVEANKIVKTVDRRTKSDKG